jgi:hypothetical protein
MTSTSVVILFAPQKLRISWVSAIPPTGEPEKLRRAIRQKTARDGAGLRKSRFSLEPAQAPGVAQRVDAQGGL